MAFVRLDDGPRPFDDILQAQRVAAGMQQQGFQNALALREFQVRQTQGERELAIAERRNDILGAETRQRAVSRAVTAGAKAGRPIPVGAAGLEQMAAYVGKRNPEALAQIVGPFAHVEFADGVDPLDTPEGAQVFESLAGAYLAEQGREAGEVASRVMVQAQTLMADPRAGLQDKDLEPLMALMEDGSAAREQVEAQYQALRTKAAANIGFAEMKTAVLAEAQQAWGSAMTYLRGGKQMTLPGEASEADKLMELRGAIETATTPEELRKARGQYLVKAHGLDGVVSEAEDAAFAAGLAAAQARFSGARDAALGQQPTGKAAPFASVGRGAAVPQGGAEFDAEAYPNLARAAEQVAGPNPLIERQRAAAEAAGFKEAPASGTPEAKEASRIFDDEEAKYAGDLASAMQSVANGADPASEAKARNVDLGVLEGVANQKASDQRFRRHVEGVWDKAKKALSALAEGATDAARRSAIVAAGAASSREEASRVIAQIDREATPQELELLRLHASHNRSASGPEQDIAEWTGIPVQRVRELLPQVRAGLEAQRGADQQRRELREREGTRHARVAAGFPDRESLIRAVAERMIDMEDGTAGLVTEVFEEEFGFTLEKSEIVEARRLRAKLVKERTGGTGG